MSSTHVSLTPTSASGLLCNSSPLATAIAVATTEADVHALANVVRGQHAPQPGASWAAEMYGPAQPPTVAVAALHPKRSSASTTSSTVSRHSPSPTAVMSENTPFTSSPPSPFEPEQQQQQQQQSRVSVVRAASLSESDNIGSTSAAAAAGADASAAQPFTTTSASSGASRLRKNVAWQCGLCGYHILAMDQDGTPLPFATSAFGNVLPLMCPRCKLSHTSWQSSTPFNEQGDHLNLPTTYSNRYVAPAGAQQQQRAQFTTDAGLRNATSSDVTARDAAARFPRSTSPSSRDGGEGGTTLLGQRAAVASLSLIAQQRAAQLRSAGLHGASTSATATLQRRAYYCGLCNRRLLRVDANGELVDMDRDAEGRIRPIRCPGCGELHSEWVVKPYAVRR